MPVSFFCQRSIWDWSQSPHHQPTTEAASIFKKIVRKEEKKKEWNGILSGESRLKSKEVEAMLYGPNFLFKKLGRYKKMCTQIKYLTSS